MPNKPMNDVISEYQKWKQQGEDLRTQAREAMETRFRELLSEAARIAQEFRNDFGAPPKPPAGVTVFRYKAGGKTKAKAKKAAAKPPKRPEPPPPPAKPDRKTAGLQKRLDNARKKLEQARAGSAPTKNLEDRVYEIEDELRLATQ